MPKIGEYQKWLFVVIMSTTLSSIRTELNPHWEADIIEPWPSATVLSFTSMQAFWMGSTSALLSIRYSIEYSKLSISLSASTLRDWLWLTIRPLSRVVSSMRRLCLHRPLSYQLRPIHSIHSLCGRLLQTQQKDSMTTAFWWSQPLSLGGAGFCGKELGDRYL